MFSDIIRSGSTYFVLFYFLRFVIFVDNVAMLAWFLRPFTSNQCLFMKKNVLFIGNKYTTSSLKGLMWPQVYGIITTSPQQKLVI